MNKLKEFWANFKANRAIKNNMVCNQEIEDSFNIVESRGTIYVVHDGTAIEEFSETTTVKEIVKYLSNVRMTAISFENR